MSAAKKEACTNDMTFADCELAILRLAVDKAETRKGGKLVHTPETQKMIKIVEDFLIKHKLICYGGTAINNILPKQLQFYNQNAEIPDYDFFSPNALTNAKQLADDFAKHGFTEVEAKSGVHHGTFKVFVNYIPIADITSIPKEVFTELKRDAITKNHILYAPPNFLRMAMFLELSRPEGDVSRWEKVLKRLILLNKEYPITQIPCKTVTFQRKMEATELHKAKGSRSKLYAKEFTDHVYDITLKALINNHVVFFGGYALTHYSQYMPRALKHKFYKNPDFDVLSETPHQTAKNVKQQLEKANIQNVTIVKHDGIGELISPHYEIKVDQDIIAFVYEPLACHSYNIITTRSRCVSASACKHAFAAPHGQQIKIATIDTILSFYLAFLYIKRPYYDPTRILCMANYLFKVQEQNRLKQRGILKRFSLKCIGHQPTKEELRALKAAKHDELKRGTKEYEEWFLNYRPSTGTIAPKSAKKTQSRRSENANVHKKQKKTRKRATQQWMPSFLGQKAIP